MILTHPHADHLDGLVSVFLKDMMSVWCIIRSATHNLCVYGMAEIDKKKNIVMKIIDKPQILELDSGVKFDFLYPDKDLSGIEIKGKMNQNL